MPENITEIYQVRVFHGHLMYVQKESQIFISLVTANIWSNRNITVEAQEMGQVI